MAIEDKYVQRILRRSVICEHGIECDTCCFLFIGSHGSNGHGRINVHYKPMYVHRVMWEFVNGMEIPKDRQINHYCNVPNCWQPNHLYLGTQKENMIDRDTIRRYINETSEYYGGNSDNGK